MLEHNDQRLLHNCLSPTLCTPFVILTICIVTQNPLHSHVRPQLLSSLASHLTSTHCQEFTTQRRKPPETQHHIITPFFHLILLLSWSTEGRQESVNQRALLERCISAKIKLLHQLNRHQMFDSSPNFVSVAHATDVSQTNSLYTANKIICWHGALHVVLDLATHHC